MENKIIKSLSVDPNAAPLKRDIDSLVYDFWTSNKNDERYKIEKMNKIETLKIKISEYYQDFRKNGQVAEYIIEQGKEVYENSLVSPDTIESIMALFV